MAWEKFGEEFNQYKENYKKEAKAKIKEYIKKNYADSKIDIKIDSKDIDYKTEAEIDNDIEYYIDNLIEYADAKKKFDESKINRDADGKFAEKNSAGNKSDEPKDNDINGKGNYEELKQELEEAKKSKRFFERELQESNNGILKRGLKKTETKIQKLEDKLKKYDNSNKSSKKSHCKVGETIDTLLHYNKAGKITTKKVIDSDNYELFTEGTVFNKLNNDQQQQIDNAVISVSKKYKELFDIYGLSDKQNDNKLKVVLLSSKYRKIKHLNGFVYRAGSEREDLNTIYINTENITKVKNIQKVLTEALMHETVHTIINDNVRNGKMKKKPEKWLEEGLAESSNIINGTGDYYAFTMDGLLQSKYHFGTNLIEYLYLKNNKNSGIFKDILRGDTANNSIKEAGNKAGINGGFKDIIKHWVKEKYKADDEAASKFYSDFLKKVIKDGW